MDIRHAEARDLARMMALYEHARRFMAEHGNPNQWGPTRWPPEDLLRRDIAQGNSYLCVQGDRIVGSLFFAMGPEIGPTYRRIEDGAWRDPSPYGVVRRLAGHGSVRGTGAFCLDWAYRQCGHLRVDTHGDNRVLQSLLGKLGFVHCGTIYVEEDPYPRLAYEKS